MCTRRQSRKSLAHTKSVTTWHFRHFLFDLMSVQHPSELDSENVTINLSNYTGKRSSCCSLTVRCEKQCSWSSSFCMHFPYTRGKRTENFSLKYCTMKGILCSLNSFPSYYELVSKLRWAVDWACQKYDLPEQTWWRGSVRLNSVRSWKIATFT